MRGLGGAEALASRRRRRPADGGPVRRTALAPRVSGSAASHSACGPSLPSFLQAPPLSARGPSRFKFVRAVWMRRRAVPGARSAYASGGEGEGGRAVDGALPVDELDQVPCHGTPTAAVTLGAVQGQTANVRVS